MGFKDKGFDKPIYREEDLEPERVIIISCEGRNTEPEYFETIKEKLSEYISVLLEIKIVPKNDNLSNPRDIVCNLENFIEDKYDYKSDYDEMWVVWDREKVQDRKNKILEMIPECQEKNYHIALTNPLFEFWLLLHIVDISTYDRDTLYDNDWTTPSKNKRFLEKELSTQLCSVGGYNKKKDKFNKNIVSKENIQKALEQEKLFENDLEKIIDNLGSNVGELINKILKI
jgi:hypothetical protein